MSGHVVGETFRRYPGDGGGELLLAVKLADNAHESGEHIFPSVATLARETRQSERTVQYQLRKMEAMGWLILVRTEERGRPGFECRKRRPREYRISPEWLAGGDPVPPAKAAEPTAAELQQQLADMAADEADQQAASEEKGANSAPFSGAGNGCNPERKRVQPEAEKGATAVAPDPSYNHQYSNRQRGARACERTPTREAGSPPSENLTAGERHGMPAGGPEAQIRFPIDWQPDQRCRDVLAARKLPMPAQWVISAFAAHWSDRWIEPRRIANEFAKWVLREAGMRGGKVPVDGESSASRQDAEAAWTEVREAFRTLRFPQRWTHQATEAAITAIGGRSAMSDLLTHQVPFKQREFVTAFIRGE